MCTIHDALNSYCIYDNVEFHRHNEMFFPSFQGAALNTDFKSKFMWEGGIFEDGRFAPLLAFSSISLV